MNNISEDSLGLHKVHLKKTNIVSDSSAPKLSGMNVFFLANINYNNNNKGFISEGDIKKYQSDVLDVNLEYWIELLGDITFHTEFYPITKEDAQTFIDSYELFEKVRGII